MKWPFYLAYKLLILLAFILYFPIILYKIILQSNDLRSIKERFGFLSKTKIKKFKDQSTIWVHAVSKEQVLTIEPLLKKIAEKYCDYELLISTVTYNGQQAAYEIDIEAELIYFPLDFSWVVRRVIKKINPQLILISETDLWPNFIRYAKKNKSKIMLVNGRLSDVSAERYNYLGPLMTEMIKSIDLFTMQSEKDVERILHLGAPRNKVYQIGNLRFDFFSSGDLTEDDKLELELNSPLVFLVDNLTQDEVADICQVYKRLKTQVAKFVMLIKPEAKLEASQIMAFFSETGARIDFEKKCEECLKDFKRGRVVVVRPDDNLANVYQQIDLILAGGSLNQDSQLRLSKEIPYLTPIIFGPYDDNFLKNRKSLFHHKMGVKVNNYQELIEVLEYYLSEPKRIKMKADLIKNTINANRLAVERNLTLLEGIKSRN